MARSIRNINQLSLPLWERTTSAALARLQAGQARLEGDLTELRTDVKAVLLTLRVHAEAIALTIPNELKANPSKLADARAILDRLERPAS